VADAPHFAYPFQFGPGGKVAEVEQGTPEEVGACIDAALRVRPGQLLDSPDFGSPDLTFAQLPLDTDAVVSALQGSEPRARVFAEEFPDRLDEALTRLRITTSLEAPDA
jgi:hypothetical protein